jgi:membrane-anchored protein YejM (alkaline phosphatase superfamily)
MAVQNYKNHLRFYPPHHFVFYPIILALLVSAIYYAINDIPNQKLWTFISILIFVMGWVAFMLRQHYALVLQDRIIRTELRYRYFVTTGTRFEPMEKLLNDAQLFALRFAPDEELPKLVQRAVAEKMSGGAIKKAILNWFPDHHRV